MRGYENVRFSELFANTVATHGIPWAATYYRKHDMGNWEFLFWLRLVSSEQYRREHPVH